MVVRDLTQSHERGLRRKISLMTQRSMAIQSVPRDKLERLTLSMRKKARNAAIDKETMQRRVMTGIVGAGSAYATGFYMGRRAAKGQSTKISGVDMELAVGGLATLSGIALQGKSGTARFGEFLESGGMGVLAYYAGTRGEDHGSAAQ